jgi:hypothetical protein
MPTLKVSMLSVFEVEDRDLAPNVEDASTPEDALAMLPELATA